jgi:hypothetical protein
MKISKIITSGLASGALRMRPEVIGVIKKLSESETRASSEPSAENANSQPPAPEAPPPAAPPPCPNQRRMVFVSPMPGRWIRWSCMMLACAALWLTHPAFAGQQMSAFDVANQAFTAGRPAEAVRGYQDIIARQGYSAPVLFNLANAQLREGQVGQAILNYQRARWLAPRDPDIAANLRRAQEQAHLPIVAPAWPVHCADLLSLNGWAGLGTVSLLLFTATLQLALLVPRARPACSLARVAALLALLGSAAAIGARWGDLDRAVVTAKEAAVRVSPVTMGQALLRLPEGSMVRIVKPHGGFALVRNLEGQQGWVSRDALSPVIPNMH